jgi:hypothetical protein
MPMDYSKYPSNWKEISKRIRFDRAGNKCEWEGCEAVNGQSNPATGSKVILTVAHLNHDTQDNRDENLMAMCQLHHLRYDAKHHAETRAARKEVTAQNRVGSK